MRKNSRVANIYASGVENLDDVAPLTLGEASMLRAIAGMIDYATKKPVKEKKPPMLYDEKKVIHMFEQATGVPLAVARYGGINRTLRTMELREDDLDLMLGWLTDVMIPWANSADNFQFTHSMIGRKYAEWLEKARQHTPGVKAGSTDGWR